MTRYGDNNGNQVVLNYKNERLSKVTGDNGHFIAFLRDDNGLVSDVVDELGRKIHYDYEGKIFGQVTDIAGNVWAYDALGNLTGITRKDSDGKTYKTEMDINADNQLTHMRITGADEMQVKYTQRAQIKSITMGERTTAYHYDKLKRLDYIIDSADGELSYNYQPGEPDIRLQKDNRTAPAQSLSQHVGHHNQSLNALYYTRAIVNPMQVITWEQALGKLTVPEPIAFNQPDKLFESSVQRRRLRNAIAAIKDEQVSFDKASNAAWLPPQYKSMNCIIYNGPCTLDDVSVTGPFTTQVGQAVTFTTVAIDNSYDCTPAYKYYVDGAYVGSWSSGTLTYTFTTPGYHQVQVNAYCDCSWFQEIDAGDWFTIYVEPEPDVCPVGIADCFTVTTETVAEQPSNRARKKLGVGEQVRLTASKPVEWSNDGPGELNVLDAKNATFKAGEVASTPKIIANAQGQSVVIKFDVVAPSVVKMELKCYRYAEPEPAVIDWAANIHLMPDDVSFYDVQVYEPYDPTVTASTSGYFNFQQGAIHYPAGSGTSDGAASEGTSTVNSGLGTLMLLPDNIRATSKGAPYSKGSFLWKIPWKYQVKGSNNSYFFNVLNQQKIIQESGLLLSTKGGVTARNDINLMDVPLCW